MIFNAKQICNAVTSRGAIFNRRRWIAVPNVSFGWGLDYEADLIAVSQDGWANEIEIKVSLSDLKADKEKKKFRADCYGIDRRVKRFWYAVPKELEDAAVAELKPEFGIISVYPPIEQYDFPMAKVVRRAKNRDARKCTDAEIQKLLHLGVMRYWDLRERAN